MSDIRKPIVQRLRKYRTQAGLTQEKLAEMAGLHLTYIGQIERGEKNVTIESTHKISAALQLPLAQLFEKVDAGQKGLPNIPLLCYELIAAKDAIEQRRMYQILLEIDKYNQTT